MSLDENGKLDFDNFANSLEATVADTDLVLEYIQLGGYAVMFPIFTAFGLGLYVLMKVTSKKKFHRKTGKICLKGFIGQTHPGTR